MKSPESADRNDCDCRHSLLKLLESVRGRRVANCRTFPFNPLMG